ncbi:MAG TPA: UdgX family uracil-DNA binding protein [Humibacter sp.]|nr:UdgX family uracil-DNA binding protein [Humibacter sp.]
MADPERPGAQRWLPGSGGVSALRDAADSCRGCELWRDATQTVFSSGPAHAAIVLVGEQPGDREDQTGQPFVGPAGGVLDDAIVAAGLDRGDLYLTNAVKHFRHRREGKRRIHETPTVGQILACHPWLQAELDIVRPRVVVCLGATAARAVLGRPTPVSANRGRAIEAPPEVAGRVVVTTHPSALLRLRGKPGWDAAFDAFVADLQTAAALAHG